MNGIGFGRQAMTVNAPKAGLAAAIVFAVAWIICSGLVLVAPDAMMAVTGSMVHGDFTGFAWRISLASIVAGLIAWSVLAGLLAWGIAAVYNRLS